MRKEKKKVKKIKQPMAVSDFKSHIRKLKGDKCSITGASHAHPSCVRLNEKEQKALEPTLPEGMTLVFEPEREYTVTFSRRVAWESHKKDTCQVFAEDIAGAVIAGVETLKMDALIAVDHSDVRIIGVCEVID